MTSEEIREIAIESSKVYYDYLDKNEKGIQEVEVFEISYPASRDLILRLRLSAKLFDTEAIFFKNSNKNKRYSISDVKIIEYDRDKNILLIKPTENVKSDFYNLQNIDLKVISDLKFLIQRVKIWYELNGASIHLPKVSSKLSKKFDNIKYFSEKEFQPSENQKESLKNIFTNPFSYIWGAPGTGKTQFVLSYAVMQYIINNDKIAILAPTNNSIEQVLRGVIKMTDKAGIERKNIIRLGTPSKLFAEEFPEVCEEKGIQKNLDEIDKQIDILERIIVYEYAISQLKKTEDSLVLFDNFPVLIENMNSEKIKYDKELEIRKRKEIDINYANEELNRIQVKKAKELVKLNSFENKFKKLFSAKSTITNADIVKIEELIKNNQKELEFLQYQFSEINNSVSEKKDNWKKIETKFLAQIESVKLIFGENPTITQIVQNINIDNWKNKKTQIKEFILREKELKEIDNHLFADYLNTPIQQLQSELTQYLIVREKLAISSTEERLKTVKVIACTLDGYIGKYAESKLNVEHIFLDEAGYANIIKALTLFNNNVPISFLGDHMQLPPVCEINDSEIQNDETFRNMFLWSQSSIYIDSIFQNNRDVCLNQYLQNNAICQKILAKTSLTSTYRFGNNLAKILANHVYHGDFNSSNPLGETKILFINAPKIEGRNSRISINEVEAIQRAVESLKSQNKNDFIILTPYKKQIRLLNNHLPQERNELKILTVHGSQGREWETVIFSVVDTADKWFVDSKIIKSKGLNLVNTAVSRAKKQLIIVCDKDYWMNQNGQLITDLLRNGTEIQE